MQPRQEAIKREDDKGRPQNQWGEKGEWGGGGVRGGGGGGKKGGKQAEEKSKKQRLKELNHRIIAQQEHITSLHAHVGRLQESRERNKRYDPHLASQASRRMEALNVELHLAQQRLDEMQTKSKRQRGGIEKAVKHIF
jgi:predicted RNase H-like nuclease (RuvC/YqgF family)